MDEKIIKEVKKAIAENVKERRLSQRITAVNAAKDLGLAVRSYIALKMVMHL